MPHRPSHRLEHIYSDTSGGNNLYRFVIKDDRGVDRQFTINDRGRIRASVEDDAGIHQSAPIRQSVAIAGSNEGGITPAARSEIRRRLALDFSKRERADLLRRHAEYRVSRQQRSS